MQNVIRFIIRYRIISTLLIFQVLGLFLTYKNSAIHQSIFWNQVLSIQGKWHGATDSWRRYFQLENINESLQKENLILRNHIRHNYYDSQGFIDSLQFKWTYGQVLYSSTHLKNNYLIINKGKIDKISKGDGVLGTQGEVMGIIDNTSDHYSRVVPMINSESRISGIVKKSGHFGTIIWRGGTPNKVKMIDLPFEIKLFLGDTIISDSRSNIFPSGIPIGWISEVFSDSANQSQTATLEIIVDYTKIQPVYIVKNHLKPEFEKLMIQ